MLIHTNLATESIIGLSIDHYLFWRSSLALPVVFSQGWPLNSGTDPETAACDRCSCDVSPQVLP